MNKQRLQELANLLRTVPAEKFDLAEWRQGVYVDDKALQNVCGTTGCAVGWACAHKPFIDQGLSWTDKAPWFEGYASWDAVETFFGLTYKQSERLFGYWEYEDRNDPIKVADRIEEFIK